MNILLIVLFIKMTNLMAFGTKKETDAATSASVHSNNQLVVSLMLIIIYYSIV
ncbi:hypothetical protein IA612_08025 [Listeria seeligeri]|uniref:hypothetical protein n=1 Tax=Listeria TaxID=1637 RepID=UPI00162435C3|nr:MULTISPECIES: hypothetical protein [Listeria]MBC1355861.1 hypothetical protein [Listeria welshimeri]MBC1361223.1 hypothetical protein [Listeria welshimeri]MBC1362773.1 hypothetical protein [Listeria welshimeri]MBC1395732.1 hypothetical protein [Listeria welshimeri]MBC1421478.1 hypothetical protein [Listeria seeligeri]